MGAAQIWEENKSAILAYIIPIPICLILNYPFCHLIIIPRRPSLHTSLKAGLGVGLAISALVNNSLFIAEAAQKRNEGFDTLPILIAAWFFLWLRISISAFGPLKDLRPLTALFQSVITLRTTYESLYAMAYKSPTCLEWVYSRLMWTGILGGVLFEDVPQFVLSLVYTLKFNKSATGIGLAVISFVKTLWTIYGWTQIQRKQMRKDAVYQLSLEIVPTETPRFAYTTFVNHGWIPDQAFTFVVQMALDGTSNVVFPEVVGIHRRRLRYGHEVGTSVEQTYAAIYERLGRDMAEGRAAHYGHDDPFLQELVEGATERLAVSLTEEEKKKRAAENRQAIVEAVRAEIFGEENGELADLMDGFRDMLVDMARSGQLGGAQR
ncbi:hypothetical protein HDV00_010621 [Rhizophlyctis rosea]|nr:hypothetical protein HDV00_010621 [Rhizophlyctis rosea]